MVNETEVNRRQSTPLRLRVDSKLWERELAGLSPEFNGGLDLGCPEQVRLLGRLRRFWNHGSRAIHVVAADLMLCAVAALRECFITANMPPLARLATLSGFGMAAP